MIGLLVKDFKLLKNQGRYFLSVFTIVIMMVLVRPGLLSTFSCGYLTFVFSYFTLSTFSYDEYNNGMSFLMTLPVSRKQYVQEKYIFGILIASLGLLTANLFTILLQTILNYSSDTDFYTNFISQLSMLLVILVFLFISLALQLKFGAEKGRAALFMMFGFICVFVYFMYNFFPDAKTQLVQFFRQIDSTGPELFIGGLVIICLGILAVTYLVSVKIMEKKEF